MNSNEPKIYVLPNLMTAGNLFCGFMAVLTIFEGMMMTTESNTLGGHQFYERAILLIFGACLFDLLDGRLARLGGQESPFGQQFDSIADVVSFGVAPALLVFNIVLMDLPAQAGWIVAFIYLLCGAMRLARFNCMINMPTDDPSKDFYGLPIPMAAATTASLTIFMIWIEEGERDLGAWRYVLPILLVLLSLMMMSSLRYPSFKTLGWKSRGSWPALLGVIVVLVVLVKFYYVAPAVACVCYVLYGLFRPWISARWRREIEEPFEQDTDNGDLRQDSKK